MRRRGAAMLTILGVGLGACGQHERPKAAEPTAGPPKEVTTSEARRGDDAGGVAVPAAVWARQRAALSARIPASVIELPYQEGQSVEAGAALVRLDDAALRAALAASEAGLKAAEADLARTEALLKKGAATPRELEEQSARVAGVRAQVAGAKDSLSYSVLRAPFAGRVAARRVNLGDVVNPGMPLIEIEGQDGFELRATVDSSVASVLRPGSQVRALVDGQSQPIGATITAVAPSGDSTTHRFEVKADLPKVAGLRAGLFARLLVPGLAGDPRITVPAAAVFERGGLTGVFVVADGKARLRWVAPGARDSGTVEIRAGVEPGERVALEPKSLADGTPVKETRATSDPGESRGLSHQGSPQHPRGN
jgi:RND family efflux transporter MFP subunit